MLSFFYTEICLHIDMDESQVLDGITIQFTLEYVRKLYLTSVQLLFTAESANASNSIFASAPHFTLHFFSGIVYYCMLKFVLLIFTCKFWTFCKLFNFWTSSIMADYVILFSIDDSPLYVNFLTFVYLHLLSTAFVIQSFYRLDLLTVDKLYPSYGYLLLLPTYLTVHFTVASCLFFHTENYIFYFNKDWNISPVKLCNASHITFS